MTQDTYINLLVKQMTGEITPEEQAMLQVWLQESPQNRAFADDLRSVWEKTGTYAPQISPDLDKAFQKIQSRIHAEQAGPIMRAQWGRPLLRIAAASAILLAAIFGIRQMAEGGRSGAETILSAAEGPFLSATLPDGSKIWLRSGSQLRYAPFAASEDRMVSLEGEGYFAVAHDPARPFKVSLQNGETVEVLGTEFDVRQADGQTTVIVRSGKVRFSPSANAEGVVLTAKQKATFQWGQSKVVLTELASLNDLSWQSGGLEFVGTPLQVAIQDIQKYHGVSVRLANPLLKNCPYTAPLSKQSAEKLLATLAEAFQCKLTKADDGTFVLSGGSCN
jgi:ferric-dicitrate binding protein FerR (iron transport regulator)